MNLIILVHLPNRVANEKTTVTVCVNSVLTNVVLAILLAVSVMLTHTTNMSSHSRTSDRFRQMAWS